MKKTNLRLLSMMLGVITLFSGAPVRGEGNFKDVKNKTGSIPFGLKVAAGVGITGALTVGVIAGCYALAKNKSSSDDQWSDSVCSNDPSSYLTNANFSNTRNLCYWHALLQHLYDIKAFKKFIKECDENFIDNTDTQKKILALREIFNAMEKRSGGVLSRDECEIFADKVFGGKKWADGESILGNQQDPSEVCTKFMPDVMGRYAEFVNCGGDGSNIFMNSVKLRSDKHSISLDDVLRENLPDELARCGAVNTHCWNNEESRLSILRRLPVSCLLSRDKKESIVVSETGFTVDADVIKKLFEINDISKLPGGIKNLIINDFSEDPKNPPILDNEQSLEEIESNWDSSDSTKKCNARSRIFSSMPISDFIVKDEQSGKWGIDRAKLKELVNGENSFEDAIKCLKNLEHAKTECVKDALDTCDLPYIRVPVIEGQFSIFISRLVFNTAVNEGIKDDIPVYFGDGTVRFGANGLFELTAVTVHSGSGMGGHYYTYKKQGGIWWKYDDLNNKPAHRVSWDNVKADSQRKCVMLTFSKKGTDGVGDSTKGKRDNKSTGGSHLLNGGTTAIKRYEEKIAAVNVENAGGLKLEISGFIHLLDIGNRKVAVASVVNAGGLGGRGNTPYTNGIAGQMVLFDGKSGKITAAGAVICEGNPFPCIAGRMVLSSGKTGEVATVSVLDSGIVLRSKERSFVVDDLVLVDEKFRKATIIGVANKDRLPLCDVILQSSPQNPTQNLYFSGCKFTSTTIDGDTHYPSFAVDQMLLSNEKFREKALELFLIDLFNQRGVVQASSMS